VPPTGSKEGVTPTLRFAPRTRRCRVKARGSGRVNSLEATNVDKHRRQRGADHAIVVAPGFAPKVIDNAETTELTTIAVDDLVELLDRPEEYAVPPEEILALLTRSGAFQDDRLDLLDE
jgi:uncharacterized protein (DUF1778 family)